MPLEIADAVKSLTAMTNNITNTNQIAYGVTETFASYF